MYRSVNIDPDKAAKAEKKVFMEVDAAHTSPSSQVRMLMVLGTPPRTPERSESKYPRTPDAPKKAARLSSKSPSALSPLLSRLQNLSVSGHQALTPPRVSAAKFNAANLRRIEHVEATNRIRLRQALLLQALAAVPDENMEPVQTAAVHKHFSKDTTKKTQQRIDRLLSMRVVGVPGVLPVKNKFTTRLQALQEGLKEESSHSISRLRLR